MMNRMILFSALSIGVLGLLMSDSMANGRYDRECNCSRPAVRQQQPRPIVRHHVPQRQSGRVCRTLTMSPQDWAACETKTWTLSPKSEAYQSERFSTRTIRICREYGHENLGYRGKATGHQYYVVFR